MTTEEGDVTETNRRAGRGEVDGGSHDDETDGNLESNEPVARGVRDLAGLVRDMYDDHPKILVFGFAVVLVVAVGVVWYALSVSLPGTLLAVLAWGGFTAVLSRGGVSYRVLERSVLGAGLYLLSVPTVVRLTTRTIDAAGNADGAEGLPLISSVVVLGVLAIYSAWAIRTTLPDSDRDHKPDRAR